MERRGHVAKGGGSPAFLLVVEVWALASQVSLPICRAQFPPPPGPRNSWFLGSLATERGDSCRHRSDPLQPHGSVRTFRRSVPSALRGRGCLFVCWGFFGRHGDHHPLLQAYADTPPLHLLRTRSPSGVSEDRARTANPRETSQVVSRNPAPSGLPGR